LVRQSLVIATTLPLLLTCLAATPCSAQFDGDKPKGGIQLGRPVTQQWKVGVEVTAVGPCTGLFATVPVPTDWPEQQVRISNEEVSQQVRRVSYRVLDNGVKQMLVSIPFLAPGESASALITFEVTKAPITGPKETGAFVVPKRVSREIRPFLAQSPYIEVRHSKIRAAAREAIGDAEGGWRKAETIYDWVRDKVEYQDGKLKGAAAALKDGTGDCEELTSLFIALCRVNKIPARTVWVPGHCYPEFYLLDAEGEGHWFPCQAAGTRAFGSMPDDRPILQKGDNFRVPEKKERQRYVAELLKVKSLRGNPPKVRYVRQLLPR
jgi:hypothetical protein